VEMESETEKEQSVKMDKFRFPRRHSLGAKHSECSDKLKITYTKQLTSDICLDIIHCLTDSALTRIGILGIRCMRQKGEREKLSIMRLLYSAHSDYSLYSICASINRTIFIRP
jgi:hypothetical protein